jgi:GAF domain-containing protein
MPPCHDQRILAANAINKLRATKDGEIESVLRLLCTVFDTDTATVALLTGECVYLTGACGGLWPCICPDRWGFCGWSFLNANHELLVIEDMEKDLRFSQNYFVIEEQFHLVFYVAAPLITSDGHRLGTLCIMGQQPRKFDATRAQLLANMAELLVRQLERTWVMQLQEEQQGKQLARSMSVYDSACLFVDVSKPTWRVLHANVPAIEQLGIKWEANYAELALFKEGRTRQPFDGMPINDVFDIEHSGAVSRAT